jgi:hypothetical protein
MTTRTTRLLATLRVVAICGPCVVTPPRRIVWLIRLVVVPSLCRKWRRRRRYYKMGTALALESERSIQFRGTACIDVQYPGGNLRLFDGRVDLLRQQRGLPTTIGVIGIAQRVGNF